jgi:acetyl esterase/lipase
MPTFPPLTCRQITANAGSIGADLTKGFVLGGCSAGGHITIPLSHRARDEKLTPPLTGIYLSVTPALAYQAVTEKYRPLYRSREELRNGISLTFSEIVFFEKTNEPDVKSPLWSPLLWPTGHANLPPTYFQICGADMLRDEALIYERELRENNIETKVDIYSGLPHVFWYTHPDHPAVPRYHEDAKNGVGWLLGQKTPA